MDCLKEAQVMSHAGQQIQRLLLEHGATEYKPSKRPDRTYLELGGKQFDITTQGKLNPGLAGDLMRKAKGVIQRIEKERLTERKRDAQSEKESHLGGFSILEGGQNVTSPPAPPSFPDLFREEPPMPISNLASESLAVVMPPQKRVYTALHKQGAAALDVMMQEPTRAWTVAEVVDFIPAELRHGTRAYAVRRLLVGFQKEPAMFSVFKDSHGDWRVGLVHMNTMPKPTVPPKTDKAEPSTGLPNTILNAIEDALQSSDTNKAWLALGMLKHHLSQSR